MRSASLAPIDCLNVDRHRLVGGRRRPASSASAVSGANAPPTPACSGCGERERPVDQAAGGGRARVGDGQRGVTGGRDHRGRASTPCSRCATPGVNAPKRRRRAERQRQRRRHGAADAAVGRRSPPSSATAAQSSARPSCGCRPLACRRTVGLVPIRTTPVPPGATARTTLALPAACAWPLVALRRTPPARQRADRRRRTARPPRWRPGSSTRRAGRSNACGCAPLTTGPPWLTTFATPLTRLCRRGRGGGQQRRRWW